MKTLIKGIVEISIVLRKKKEEKIKIGRGEK